MSNPGGEAGRIETPSIAQDNQRDGLPIGAVAWAFFEAARVPYIILITMYIFAPYVVTTLIGGDRPDAAVKGQEIFSRWNTYSSAIVMCTAPFLGASIDKLGQRKLMLAGVVSLMVALIFSLWWAKPDHSGLGVVEILLILALANVLLTYNEVLHNSLLVRAAGLGQAHRASGLALSLGNGLGTVVLAFATWAFVLPGHVDWVWVPDAPLFGLDPASHEDERIVGPIAAIIILIGSLPLFLFTPDEKPTGMRASRAFREGAATLWRMIQTVKN